MSKKVFLQKLLEPRLVTSMWCKTTCKYNMSNFCSYKECDKQKVTGLLAHVPEKQLLKPLFYQKNYVLNSRNYAVKQDDNESDGEESDSDYNYSAGGNIFNSRANENHVNVDVFRNSLYPNSSDPLICKLKECGSVQEVFDIISQCRNEFNGCHASQAVLILCDLQKMFISVTVERDYPNLFPNVRGPLNEYVEKLHAHEDFHLLLQILQSKITELTPDAATYTLLSLLQLGVTNESQVIQELISYVDTLISSAGSLFPLTALSRYTIAIERINKSRCFIFLQDAIPLIFNRIETCSTAEEMRLLTVCLINIKIVICPHYLQLYRNKVQYMLDKGIISSEDIKAIVKMALFLNNPNWSQENTHIITKLLTLLKGNMKKLSVGDMLIVHKIFESQLEPAHLFQELKESAEELLEKQPDFSSAFYSSTDLLLCVVSFSSPREKSKFESQFCEHIEKASFPEAAPILYKILRYLKTNNPQLCNVFWSRLVENLKENPSERGDTKLLRICHRYMYFNNNMGGTFRHDAFENYMIQLLMEKCTESASVLLPSKFARMASFLIAYATKRKYQNKFILEVVAEKLQDISSQLSEIDCLYIARGFQLSMNLEKRLPSHILTWLVHISSVLNTCTRKHLNSSNYDLMTTNIIMRGYLGRKTWGNTHFTDVSPLFIDRYENFTGIVTSRLLRDAVSNFQNSYLLIPKALDRLSEYVINNNIQLFGDTIEKLLYLCYSLGYTPGNADKLLPIASEMIVRDKTTMTGLHLLQSALALSFFRHLPVELIHYIFTVEFLEMLDEEITTCYSKTSYPSRLRNSLMALNRAVCLDFPEVDVPWFHKKYCEERVALEPVDTSLFYKEMKEILVDLVGGKEYVTLNTCAPYGIKTDFQIFMNYREEAVRIRQHSDKNITKIAVLLHKENAYTFNIPMLKGPYQMKKRHLEILGYKVIGIPYSLWNSMYMSERNAKYNFVKNSIWQNSSKHEKQCIF